MNALPLRDELDDRFANQIALLATLGADFAAAADPGQTLFNAISRTMEHLNAEAGSIFLLDKATQILECHACAGPLDITGLKLQYGQGIIGRAVATKSAQIVLDVVKDDGFDASVDAHTGFVTRSILCAPLQIKGKALGAIEVINKKSADGLFSPVDASLLNALAALIALAIHNARMTTSLVGKERMRKELELAAEIQRSLLPQSPADSFPVHGLNVPALEMSGDFYHFFELADQRICFCLGDVSGKGMNASLMMAKAISLFQCLAKTIHQPGTLLAAINNEVTETATQGMFITIVTGIYDPRLRQVVFANAGHQPPLHRDEQGIFQEFEANEPPVGIVADIVFSEHTLQLDGGSLYMFTDGLTEGRLKDGSELGIDGVKSLLGQLAHLPRSQRLHDLVAHLQETDASLRDDTTILVVEGMMKEQVLAELRLPAQADRLALIRACVRDAAKLACCDTETIENVVLAVNEACMNVIQHAYCFACDQEMLLRIRQEPGAVIFELLDHAKPVCREDVKPRELDDLRPGGLGVHFIRTIMDEMSFVEPPAGFGNMLRMVKRINENNKG